jgi:hypothetical protein
VFRWHGDVLAVPTQTGGDVLICRPHGLAKRLGSDGPGLSVSQIRAITSTLEAALVPADTAVAATTAGRKRLPGQRGRQRQVEEVTTAEDGSAGQVAAPACRCSARMTMRARRSDGERFYGCTTYPRCRQTRPWTGGGS